MERAAELGLILEAFLEEIRSAVRARVEESHRVTRLGVLAEHDDAHVGMLVPQLGGEADPLVGVRGRHPDVRQDDVRLGALDGGSQLVEVARHLHDLDVFDVVEDADDPLTGEEAVLGDDDADRHPHERSQARISLQVTPLLATCSACTTRAEVFPGVEGPRPNEGIPQCARRFVSGRLALGVCFSRARLAGRRAKDWRAKSSWFQQAEHGASALTDARRALRSAGWAQRPSSWTPTSRRRSPSTCSNRNCSSRPAGLRTFRGRRSSTGFAPQARSRCVLVAAPAGLRQDDASGAMGGTRRASVRVGHGRRA